MLRNGSYSAWYRTRLREGTGVVVLNDGKITGGDALAQLQWLCANQMDVPVGRIIYTGLLNARGTYESDVTVIRLAADRFYMLTATQQVRHDADWILRQVLADAAEQRGRGRLGVSNRQLVNDRLQPRQRFVTNITGCDTAG